MDNNQARKARISLIKEETEKWIHDRYLLSNPIKVKIARIRYTEYGINNVQKEFNHIAFLIADKYYFLSFDWDGTFDINLPNTYPLQPLSLSLKSRSAENVTVLYGPFYIGEAVYNESEILEIGEKIINLYENYVNLYWEKDSFGFILLEVITKKILVLPQHIIGRMSDIIRWQFPKSTQLNLLEEFQNLWKHRDIMSEDFKEIIRVELFFREFRAGIPISIHLPMSLREKISLLFSRKIVFPILGFTSTFTQKVQHSY